MRIRGPQISASISRAISRDHSDDYDHHGHHQSACLPQLSAFFRLFRLHLILYRSADFLALRTQTWLMDEDAYLASFPRDANLVPMGDLGYSGSTFFTTPDGHFLVKSLPRRFEHAFFTDELFDPYRAHMAAHPDSLLVRITDMPYAALPSLGGLIGTAPTHHIVMENLLFDDDGGGGGWETFDLKPEDYFFPERDIASGALAPDSVIENLIDRVPHKIVVSAADREKLMRTLEEDTHLLATHSAVDYSLFLARRRRASSTVESSSSNWREGVSDVDGVWTYRCVVLDFFWAKSRLAAQAMTGLVNAYNVVADQGPMSITADPGEYRERFIKMVERSIVGSSN